MSRSLVSVVIPVYNVEKYLRECMDSILGQSYGNLEVICVNDGSTDSSLSILESYASEDTRIRVFSKDNEGVGGASARNYGLKLAGGEYVCVLDSDDFFDRDMIKKAVERAEETHADITVFGGYEYDDKTGAKIESRGILDRDYVPDMEVFSHRDCPETILQFSSGMAWNKLFRRSFINKHGIQFQQIKYSDDAFFTFSLMVLANRVSVINENLICYRVNSGRNQTNGIADYPDSSYVPYISLMEYLMKYNLYYCVEKSFLNCAAAFMKYCYEKIDRSDAFVYLHDKFRNEVFEKLSLSDKSDDYFRDRRLAMWIKQVSEYTAEEILFRSARAHGSSDSTTGILRFQFPYEFIPVNSRIAILGDRIVGRHYMSQAVLSGQYDVVLWVDKENSRKYKCISGYEELKNMDFDYALITYTDRRRIDEAVSALRESGVQEDRIFQFEDEI